MSRGQSLVFKKKSLFLGGNKAPAGMSKGHTLVFKQKSFFWRKKSPCGNVQGQSLVFHKKPPFGQKKSPCGNVQGSIPSFQKGTIFCEVFAEGSLQERHTLVLREKTHLFILPSLVFYQIRYLNNIFILSRAGNSSRGRLAQASHNKKETQRIVCQKRAGSVQPSSHNNSRTSHNVCTPKPVNNTHFSIPIVQGALRLIIQGVPNCPAVSHNNRRALEPVAVGKIYRALH